ncbi:MAG: DUF424 domain-containing protein [Candidatus Micrarchaeia archaeon]
MHERMGKKVVAVCDEELIGKIYEEGEVVLDLKTYKDFYVGKVESEKEIKKYLEKFDSANIVGEKSVSLAISLGLCKKSEIRTIAGIPHIQVYKF